MCFCVGISWLIPMMFPQVVGDVVLSNNTEMLEDVKKYKFEYGEYPLKNPLNSEIDIEVLYENIPDDEFKYLYFKGKVEKGYKYYLIDKEQVSTIYKGELKIAYSKHLSISNVKKNNQKITWDAKWKEGIIFQREGNKWIPLGNFQNAEYNFADEGKIYAISKKDEKNIYYPLILLE